VLLTTAGDIEGITLSFYAPREQARLDSIDFSQSYLQALGLEPDWTFVFQSMREDGYLAGTIAMSLGGSVGVAPDEVLPISVMPEAQSEVLAQVEFSVEPDVPLGTRFDISFRSAPGGSSFLDIRNEISRRGFAQAQFLCGLTVEIVDGKDLFIRGDANRDSSVNVADAVAILRYLFASQAGSLPCPDAADADDSGRIDLADAILLVSYLFRRSSAPVFPFPTAGRDWSPGDLLGCEE
jgi:hypothetical protein